MGLCKLGFIIYQYCRKLEFLDIWQISPFENPISYFKKICETAYGIYWNIHLCPYVGLGLY
jgi:hypothetical protein